MRFATLEEVQSDLPLGTTTSKLPNLELMLEVASEVIEATCRRKFTKAEYTEYFDGGDGERATIRLQAIPVDTAQPFSLWDDPNGVFDSTSLLDTTTYTLNPESGLVERVYSPIVYPRTRRRDSFMPGSRSIKVTYTGGYVTASKNNQTVVQVPSRVKLATLALVRAWLLNRDAIGRGGASSRQGTTVDQSTSVPPQVMSMLGPERRILYA